MPLILPKCDILLIPRTGSTWVRQAVRNAKIKYLEHGPKHGLELPYKNRFTIAFIREPGPWLKSRWMLGPWEDELRLLWDKDYEVFRSRVNDGMIAAYFKRYTDKCQPGFVGRQENLAQDLIAALTQAGETFDPQDILSTPLYNTSDYESMELVQRPGHPKNECRQPAFASS